MDWKRAGASLVNWFGTLFFVNVVLWLCQRPLLGERMFGVKLPEGRLNLCGFALLTFIIFGSVIGFLANFVFWLYNKNSIPTIIFYKLVD